MRPAGGPRQPMEALVEAKDREGQLQFFLFLKVADRSPDARFGTGGVEVRVVLEHASVPPSQHVRIRRWRPRIIRPIPRVPDDRLD